MNMPTGWEIRKLGELLSVQGGFAFDSKLFNTENGMPLIRIRDLKKGIKTETLYLGSYDESFVVNKEDLLIGMDGEFKCYKWKGNQALLNQRVCRLINFSKELDRNFLFYDINKHLKEIEDKTSFSTVKHISASQIREITINLPPIPTQIKIANILEKADALKQKRKQANKLLDELLQSVFLDMFGDPVSNPKGWEYFTLEELSSYIIDCPHSTPKHSEQYTPFASIRTSELKNGYIDWSKMKYVSEEEYLERIKRLKPLEGDIIYGREGSFGEAIRIPPNVNICLGQRVMLFRANANYCNSYFLWSLLRSKLIYNQALNNNTGSTVGHVNVQDIKKFIGICPPLTLQNEFASIVEKIQTLKDKAKKSEMEIDNLFNSLMQKAFNGELEIVDNIVNEIQNEEQKGQLSLF